MKKIEVSSVRYEKNEKSVSQLTCWADHILTRLDDGLQRLDLEDQQLLHEETEAEVRGQQEAADEVIKEGTNLISGEWKDCSAPQTCHLVSINKHME